MEKDSLGITEQVIRDALIGMLDGYWTLEETALDNCRVRTSRQAGFPASDRSVLITFPDGTEFELTITRRQ